MWWLALLSLSALAQDNIDVSAINLFDDKLPNPRFIKNDPTEVATEFKKRKFNSPHRTVNLSEIEKSEKEYGAIISGVNMIRIEDNKPFKVTGPIYTQFYRREDEHGFRYLINKDGTTTYKIDGEYVESIKQEMALYEQPLRYTPAPKNISRAEYDKKLSILPEATFYAGYVQSDYMKDLFNDNKAGTGYSTQYGAQISTKWKVPLKVGASIHYESAHYYLSKGQINYSSLSFGPQFKTKNFELLGYEVRLQTQFRVSPFATATAQTQTGDTTFKFNSADLLTSIEHPIKNYFGEFVVGFFFQSQWLNIKNQTQVVRINSSNQTNKSFGLSIAQVFD
jgi:hypothetical protein